MRRCLALSMAVLALGLVAAGCGDDDDDEGGDGAATTEQPAPADTGAADTEAAPAGGGEALTLSSPEDGSLSYDKTELTAPAGEVTIDYENPSSTPHNVTIEGTDAATETIMEAQTSISTELEAGEYTFFCSVGQHRQAGMEGTLTVE